MAVGIIIHVSVGAEKRTELFADENIRLGSTEACNLQIHTDKVIADGVWLGGGAIVCPGVTVGENTVVGAGAVVVKDLPAGVLAVGNPARPIRDL